MSKQICLHFILFLLFYISQFQNELTAQNYTVTGSVMDAGNSESLFGVTIKVLGTSEGAVTDVDGKFSLNLSEGSHTLEISYLGYETQKIIVENPQNIIIKLVVSQELLKEVVVVGYGVQKKSDLTGAVSTVRGADLIKIPSSSPEQALQGKVAGLQVNSSSGAPGALPVVRVRGVGTFNNSNPIYVVDGVILDDISFLSSADIASIEVLKDASSTAIYGSRGANGVLLVTTKQGSTKSSAPVYNFTAEYGLQILSKKIDLLDSKQFGQYVNNINPGTYNNLDALPNTDWQSLIFKNAPIQNYHFSIAGSGEKQQYYIGVGLFNQEGIIDKSNFQRLSIKLNNTYKLTNKLKIGNNITIAPFSQDNAPNVTYQAYRAQPLIAPYTNTGAYSEVPGVGNPLADLANSNSKNRGFRAVANIFGEYKIMEPLSFRTSFGVDYGYLDNVNFTPAFYVSPQQQNELNDLSIRKENNSSLLFENTLTYDKRFENHNFNVLAGYTMQRLRSNILGLAAENIIGETSNLWYINKSNINPNSIQNEVNANYNYSLLSYLFRVNYTFQSKYLFTASYRRDGSSKFSKDNRYGNFPSFAVGWNLMNENFMQNNTLFNKIKLRSSWGQIGNEKISYLDQYALVLNDVSPVFGLNETINPGSTYGKAGNRNIKWETTTQTDVGLELGLWDDKITSEIDYYNRVTDNILVELSTPGYTGNGQGQKIRYNAGKVQNSGLEMNVAYNGKKGLLNYRISAIASTINNKVLSVGGNSGVDSTLVGGFLANGQSVTLTKEGLPIGAFYGYQVSGIYQNAEQLNSLPKESLSEVGDLIYVDSNNDGKINSKDRVFIGSPIPKFIYGLSFEASFKSFEFNLDFQGQTGNKIYNGKEAVRPDLYNFENHVIDRWTGEGTSNSEPKATAGGVNWLPSQRFLQDGSFIRLRNITIAYKVPDSSLKRLRLSNAKIFIRGTNVWTLTKFTGYTPEITSSDVLSAGIDKGIYPITAVYTTGININF